MSKSKAKKERNSHKRKQTASTDREALGRASMEALFGLCLANRHKTAPDPKAVAVLAEGIERWRQSGGKRTLDDVFGLSAVGRGGDHALAPFNVFARDGRYFHDMALLVGAGFTVAEAAEAIAEYHERIPTAIEKCGAVALAAKTIYGMFEREGGIKLAREAGYFGELGSKPTLCETTLGEERQRLIRQLAQHLIPASLKVVGNSDLPGLP